MAEAIDRRGCFKEAEEEYRKILADCERIQGEDDQDTSLARCDLAVFLTRRGRLAEAESLHREALRARKQTNPRELSAPWSMHCLAETLRRQGKYDEARKLHLEGLQNSRTQGKRDVEIRFLSMMARLFEDMGDHDVAQNHLDRAIAITTEPFRNRPHPFNAKAQLDKGCFFNRHKRYSEAEPLLREALEGFDNITPRHYHRFVAASALGQALAGLGQYEAAEQLLLKGHDGLKAIPYAYFADEGTAAIERLVKLYELRDQKRDQCEYWQNELADLQAIKSAMANGDSSLLPVPPEK